MHMLSKMQQGRGYVKGVQVFEKMFKRHKACSLINIAFIAISLFRFCTFFATKFLTGLLLLFFIAIVVFMLVVGPAKEIIAMVAAHNTAR